ncbi:MAG: long-chain fatty acid--CoA ligase [Deltaproteobacteria bacterium]|jgi:long-chain acyl-CoA synthetase|nr:long-chain fatty acid--CoA ligase [Deltaproteobacteria bacterium]MBW2537495.1 long-chain fatty acid--CoA ligase [Deltaproteobacteria bacterium]
MDVRHTIAHLADRQRRRYGDRPLFHHLQGGHWRGTTWRESTEQAEQVGAGLWSLGCRHGDRVAILCETRAEWSILDLAVLGLGGVVVGIYPTSTASQVQYVLAHSESKVVFVEDATQLAKVEAVRADLPALEQVVVIDSAGAEQGGPDQPLSLETLRARGREGLAESPELVERCLDAVEPGDVATLVYTSGTTGPPKGVVLTHRNLFEIADITCRTLGLSEQDVSAVFLPLAHSLQRVSLYAGLRAGCSGYFAPSLDQLLETWQAAQPSIMSSVPRVFEKVHNRILAGVSEQPRRRQRIFAAAMALGRRRSRYLQQRRPVPWHVELAYRLVDRMVFSRIRARIFGRRIRYLISGGAPISVELLEFFHAMGLPIYEGYGLTETSAPATLNLEHDFRFGTVGKPLPGVDLKIAPDGEVLIRGPGVFREYYREPDATRAALDEDGWFRSGDIGELDADGFLRITDRKKDLIITAGGKNIAPQNLENLLKADPHVSQALVHGDRRKYLVALITLDAEQMAVWAADHGKAHLDWPALMTDPEVEALVGEIVDRTNAALARYETLKAYRIICDEFTVENDMITPTLKLKRRVIEERYRSLLDGMYQG